MKKRGSILIIVLWALFILGALAVALSAYVSAQIDLSRRLSDGTLGYYIAKGGIECAIMEVKNDPTQTYDALTDSWSNNNGLFKDARLGDGTYSILPLAYNSADTQSLKYGLSDEERKINVNKAPKDVLKNLFQIAAGVGEDEAVAIAASIINWRSPADHADKDGADSFHYQTLDRPYKCKNAPIEVPEELLLIKGITAEIFNKVRDYITIYGTGAVNINTADELALRSIGMSQSLAEKVVRFRGGDKGIPENIFDDTAKITALLAKKESLSGEESGKINNLIGTGLLSVTSDNFAGIAIGKTGFASGKAAYRIAFIFDRKNNVIRYWRE